MRYFHLLTAFWTFILLKQIYGLDPDGNHIKAARISIEMVQANDNVEEEGRTSIANSSSEPITNLNMTPSTSATNKEPPIHKETTPNNVPTAVKTTMSTSLPDNDSDPEYDSDYDVSYSNDYEDTLDDFLLDFGGDGSDYIDES